MLSRSESDEIEVNDLVNILIQSGVVSGDEKLLLGMTSLAHHECVLSWLLENLTILNHPANVRMLSFLDNIISEQDEQAEDVARNVLGILSWSKAGMYQENVLNRLVATIRDHDVTDSITENSAFTNAAFFGNHQLIKELLDKGFTLPPRIYQKAKGDYLDALEKGKYQENSLLICKAIIDHTLRDVLNKVKHIIKTQRFVLNGGGDDSIAEIGHAVTAHAAKVFNMVDASLKSNLSLTDTYYQLTADIIGELRTQDKRWFAMVGLFTVRGERDQSTSDCYAKISRAMIEGLAMLNEYTTLADMKVDQVSLPRAAQESILKPFSY